MLFFFDTTSEHRVLSDRSRADQVADPACDRPGLIHLQLQAAISLEFPHQVASMASGGMDTLPHIGTVITLLAITGLTHRESYFDIFAITILKTAVVFALAFAISFAH
jgi:H+/gluconate symporter-like permease